MTKFEIEQILKNGGIEDYRLCAKELFNAFCGKELEEAIALRLKNLPLQYILGEWEFYSLPFIVGEGVLIPRADTEVLVEEALKHINQNSCVLDLCSGSGAIGIALQKYSGATVYCLEKSQTAIKYLNKNVALNNVQVTVLNQDIFNFSTNLKFDLIVSNPPYIKTKDLKNLQKEVLYEPTMALDGGEDGLVFYKQIVKFKDNLNKGGKLILEVGYDTADDVNQLLISNGFKTKVIKDLNGVQRVVFGTLNA